jgi:membrane fusion protein, multidrug efflux system
MSKKWMSGTALVAGLLLPAAAVWAAPGTLSTAPVAAQSAGTGGASGFDGVVEAVRQTVVAAQVAGAVTAIDVKAGDSVKAGQVLARIDARAAEQTASASEAQVQAARALLDVASKDFERQKQLFDKQYISQAALERAESQFKATQAQAAAMLAQAGAARTQSGFYVVRAPFAGVVAEVPVALGDMAMPGRALLTLYEPGALRVTAAVPQTALVQPVQGAKLEFPGLPAAQRWFAPTQVQVLPTVDAGTHTVQLRIALPPAHPGVAPGMFARVWLPAAQADAGRLVVPAAAIVRRAEVTAVYVVGAKGAPVLRQVRLGRATGDTVEVLSGLSAGDRVALDPQAAARAN